MEEIYTYWIGHQDDEGPYYDSIDEAERALKERLKKLDYCSDEKSFRAGLNDDWGFRSSLLYGRSQVKETSRMEKWAFTYNYYSHLDRFVGPFDSYEKMLEFIINMTDENWDDEVTSHHIKDSFLDGELSSPDDVRDIFNIRFFRVSEEPVDVHHIYNGWDKKLDEIRSEWEMIEIEQREEKDRQEYERLKRKYGDSPG